ncbi:hypothetical protein C8J56DRAFT_379086 [Mycena floridula]|nr:hypothetical protein C8J56DRAFT_379086 [Mycena floridula]
MIEFTFAETDDHRFDQVAAPPTPLDESEKYKRWTIIAGISFAVFMLLLFIGCKLAIHFLQWWDNSFRAEQVDIESQTSKNCPPIEQVEKPSLSFHHQSSIGRRRSSSITCTIGPTMYQASQSNPPRSLSYVNQTSPPTPSPLREVVQEMDRQKSQREELRSYLSFGEHAPRRSRPRREPPKEYIVRAHYSGGYRSALLKAAQTRATVSSQF